VIAYFQIEPSFRPEPSQCIRGSNDAAQYKSTFYVLLTYVLIDSLLYGQAMSLRDFDDVTSQSEMDEDEDVYGDLLGCQSNNGCCCCCCRGQHTPSHADCVLDLDLHGVTRLNRPSSSPLRRSVIGYTCHLRLIKKSTKTRTYTYNHQYFFT